MWCINMPESVGWHLRWRNHFSQYPHHVGQMGDKRPGRKPRVSNEEIIDIFKQSEDPVLTASELAEQIPITRRSTYDRLVSLEEDGILHSKKVGGRTTIWWLPGHTATKK